MVAGTDRMTQTGTEDSGGASPSLDSQEPARVQRKRAEHLRRMCRRHGFIQDFHISVGPDGAISGYIRANARLIRQSLAPVLRARGIEWTTDNTAESSNTRRCEGVVTIQLSDEREAGQC